MGRETFETGHASSHHGILVRSLREVPTPNRPFSIDVLVSAPNESIVINDRQTTLPNASHRQDGLIEIFIASYTSALGAIISFTIMLPLLCIFQAAFLFYPILL